MHCTGNETSLGDCFGSDATSFIPVGEVTCNSHAGVICEGMLSYTLSLSFAIATYSFKNQMFVSLHLKHLGIHGVLSERLGLL